MTTTVAMPDKTTNARMDHAIKRRYDNLTDKNDKRTCSARDLDKTRAN